MTESTQTHQLDITRVFDAPREVVFRCMIEPEHLTHFWGPVGMSTPLANITIEPWAGGRFETIMVNDETGEEYPSRGVFVEVIEPEKLVWTEPSFGITSTSTFTDLGDGRTEVHIHQSDLPEQFATPEAREGFNSSLDRFAAYLATL
ncbi:MAG TPA: SRPBCC domain-containing protein [Acidimicrobiia bacterium]|jgi:uncharacterized protein YndB with AHSA1/START domain|nr:SRPBCC domain-containing protein [Acidimicrobiia bacterium]